MFIELILTAKTIGKIEFLFQPTLLSNSISYQKRMAPTTINQKFNFITYIIFYCFSKLNTLFFLTISFRSFELSFVEAKESAFILQYI